MQANHSQQLLEGSIIKSLLFLAVPIVITNLLQTAYQLTDAFWVGRLGGASVAAVSVSGPITFLAMALGMGFSIAAASFVAQHVGAKQWDKVAFIVGQALSVAVVLGVTFGIIGFLVTPYILTMMGVGSDVYPLALGFMHMSFLTLPFTFVFVTYQSVVRSVGEVKTPFYIVLTTVALNAVLDPLFMYGYGVLPAYGVMGAAIATFLTQGLSVVIGIMLLLRGTHGFSLTAHDMRIDWAFLKKLTRFGIPTSLEQTVRALSMTAMTVLVAAFGTTAIASYGVANNMLMVIIIPALGLSLAVATLVGQNVGAGQVARAKQIVRLGAVLSFSMLTVVSVLAYIGAPYIVHFFITAEAHEVAQMATAYTRVLTLTFGAIGVQMVFLGVFRAVGKPIASLVLTVVTQIGLQFPVAFVLSHYTSLGFTGIWWSSVITNVIAVGITVLWYRSIRFGDNLITQDEVQSAQASEDILEEEGVQRM